MNVNVGTNNSLKVEAVRTVFAVAFVKVTWRTRKSERETRRELSRKEHKARQEEQHQTRGSCAFMYRSSLSAL